MVWRCVAVSLAMAMGSQRALRVAAGGHGFEPAAVRMSASSIQFGFHRHWMVLGAMILIGNVRVLNTNSATEVIGLGQMVGLSIGPCTWK